MGPHEAGARGRLLTGRRLEAKKEWGRLMHQAPAAGIASRQVV